MNGTRLAGLEGTNPLGFLAALGVLVAFAREDKRPRLWWSDDLTPRAIVDEEFSVERIVDQALGVAARWEESPAVNPKRPDGSAMPKGDALKLDPSDIRSYLRSGPGNSNDSANALMWALVAEASLDKQGVAKPSDLYFTAGQQKFLDTTRKILRGTTREDILGDLEGPWRYDSKLPSLGWDVVDDREYALRANDPSPEKKLTNPGAEALAILGLSLHPVFTGRDRTLTQGCSGTWKAGYYSWPLWCRPAAFHAVRSLLAHAYDHPNARERHAWFRSWGVLQILRSPIRRSGQGGYGTFGPPEITWQATGPPVSGTLLSQTEQLVK